MPTLEIKPQHSGSAPAPPPLGTIIDDGKPSGSLHLNTVLGYGGYGVVYRALAPSGNAFAVKCLLRTSSPSNPKQQQRQRRLHLREIALHQLAAGGRHPGVVSLHRVIEPSLPDGDGKLTVPSPYTFLVMDFAPCGDLFTLILHRQVYLGRTALVSKVFAQLCDAVAHCHSLGIYHRDLKPENVLCWDNGATVRLSDFGLATTEKRSKEWRTGSVYHMSPECQNGNPSSPPYSPLANDIWSLAILLLNLLTARNPWARASPSDPTFSAYLSSPRNFLPQVLPISAALNDVLVRALDIQMERRELFGVRGLAEGVARLSVDNDGPQQRRTSSVAARKSPGMYAPDVVFEGGMARCPWEVGMHIPSGSSGIDEDDDVPAPVQIPQEVEVQPPPRPQPRQQQQPAQVHKRISSYGEFEQMPVDKALARSKDVRNSVVHASAAANGNAKVHAKAARSRSPSASAHKRARYSASSTSSSSSTSTSAPQYTRRDAPTPAPPVPGDSISDIRFASPSAAASSASSSSFPSTSSSASRSSGSYRGPGSTTHHTTPPTTDTTPHFEDVESDRAYAYGYANAYAADPDTPQDMCLSDKAQYADPYTAITPRFDASPTRRHRYRGRQPYPHGNGRQNARGSPRPGGGVAAAAGARKALKPKPDLSLDIDIPAPRTFLPSFSSSPSPSPTRTPSHSRRTSPLADLQMRARGQPVSSCPFAYTVSRSRSRSSYSPSPEPDMDVDRERGGRDAEDVHMISPSAHAGDADEDDSYDQSYVSPVRRPGGKQVVTVVERSPVSPSTPRQDSEGREIVQIERSTLATTLTASQTDTSPCYHRSNSRQSRNSVTSSAFRYDYDFARSASPSPASSVFNLEPATRMTVTGNRTEDSMETDAYTYGDNLRDRNDSVIGGSSWEEDLRRAMDDNEGDRATGPAAHSCMEVDALEMPELPGAFPASSSPSPNRQLRRVSGMQQLPRPQSRESQAVSSVRGLGLELYSSARQSMQVHDSRLGAVDSAYTHALSSVYSGENQVPVPAKTTRPAPPTSRNTTDDALRALHESALNPAPWTVQPDYSGWGHATSASSYSSSTRPEMTFMALTTDVATNARPSRADLTNVSVHGDFQEYAHYLQYAGSYSSMREKSRQQHQGEKSLPDRPSLLTSTHSFLQQSPVIVSRPASFRDQESAVAPARQESISQSRRRSATRTRSLLRFVGRRPFSSTGSGSASFRARTPSLTHDPEPCIKVDALDAQRVQPAIEVKAQPPKPRSIHDFSATRRGSATKTRPSRASSTPHASSRPAIPSKPAKPSPPSRDAPKATTNTPKLRAWSFARARSPPRRRSRSLSPQPTRGSPRDVLLRLRSARNWFWFALSGMATGPSTGSGTRSRKAATKRCVPLNAQLIGVAA